MVWERTAGDKVMFNGTLAGLAAVGGYGGYLIFNWIYPPK